MTETRETLKPEVFHVKANCFTFNHKGKEVTLPKCGYTPSYKDNLVIVYDKTKNTTSYVFEGKDKETKASFAIDPNGNVDVKIKGKNDTYVSSEDMNKIKAGKVGLFFRSAEQMDFIENNRRARVGGAALSWLVTGFSPVTPVIMWSGMKVVESVRRYKNHNPNEFEMNVTSVTHEGEAPKRELTRKEMLDQISRRHGWRR